VLADIDDYLQRWGHYRLAVDMHERLNGRLTRPYWQMATANALGTSYATLGQTGRAIEHTSRPPPSPARSATAASKAAR
jgi:hypothetical protein